MGRAQKSGDALSGGWRVGWSAGAAVVVVAASLLVTITALARRISRQAHEIVVALDGAESNTSALWDVSTVNAVLQQVVESLPARDEHEVR